MITNRKVLSVNAAFLVAVIVGLPAVVRGDFIEVFTDDGNGFIDHDLEPNGGANYTGVPTPTNSTAGYNSFVSTLGLNADIGVEDFESFSAVNPFGVAGAAVNLQLEFDRIAPGVGSLPIMGTLDGTGVVSDLTIPRSQAQIDAGAPANPDNESGRFPVTVPVGGSQYFSTNFGELAFTIDFSSPVLGLGFFGTDFGDFNGQTVIDITAGDDSVHSFVMPHQRTNVGGTENFLNASLLFYGLVGDNMTIKSATFRNQGSTFDRFGFDNLVVATTEIPEPSSMMLLASGMLVGGFVYRRRSRRAGDASA